MKTPFVTAPTLARRRVAQWLALAPAAALFAAPVARAHGDAAHAKPNQTPTVFEQKPWGIAAQPGQAQRTVQLTMHDTMRFTPDHLEVTEGEVVRIRVKNAGKMLHEIVIGTPEELDQHAALMKRFPNMQHDEPYMAHVPPARRGELVWTFNRPGLFAFACLIPGHFEAGMRGTVRVRPKA